MARHDDRRPGPGPDVPRLFFAVPVPAVVGARVGQVIDDTRAALGDDGRRVRWVQVEGLHVTLRFLGPTPTRLVAEAAAALDRAVRGRPAFEVRLAGAGAFPSADRPRALWLGIREGAESLGELAAALEVELRAAGWVVEPRAFRPHLTIARTDGVRAGPAAAAALEAAADDLDAAFTAERVVLFRSHLGSGPARYEPLNVVALA